MPAQDRCGPARLLWSRRRAVLVSFLSVLLASPAAAQDSDYCLQSVVTFKTSALEQIMHEPARVLEDEDGFWAREEAQVFTNMWAAAVGYDFTRDAWRRELRALADLSPDERADHTLLRMTETIIREQGEFLAYALPHVCSYFPDSARLDVPIHFTAFIPPRSFAMGGIVINVAADYWKGDPANILNNLIHELGHAGYTRCRDVRSETPHPHDALYAMLESLQNEGVCTYVGYEAREAFPAPDEVDYQLLDSPEDVRRLLVEVNRLFARVGDAGDEELARDSWNTGVMDRAYYITGAHMCRVIDSGPGRDSLIYALSAGPVTMVEMYNALVTENLRIRVPDLETIVARQNAAARRAWQFRVLAALGGAVVLILVIMRLLAQRRARRAAKSAL